MRTSLRLPEDLAERIRQRAENEQRSMHSMMLGLIEKGLGPERSLSERENSSGEIQAVSRRGGMATGLVTPQPRPRSESDRPFKPDFKAIK